MLFGSEEANTEIVRRWKNLPLEIRNFMREGWSRRHSNRIYDMNLVLFPLCYHRDHPTSHISGHLAG